MFHKICRVYYWTGEESSGYLLRAYLCELLAEGTRSTHLQSYEWCYQAHGKSNPYPQIVQLVKRWCIRAAITSSSRIRASWRDADSVVACNTDLLKSFHAILCRVDSPSANPIISTTLPVEEVGAANEKSEGRSELLLPCLKMAYNNKEWMT